MLVEFLAESTIETVLSRKRSFCTSPTIQSLPPIHPLESSPSPPFSTPSPITHPYHPPYQTHPSLSNPPSLSAPLLLKPPPPLSNPSPYQSPPHQTPPPSSHPPLSKPLNSNLGDVLLAEHVVCVRHRLGVPD